MKLKTFKKGISVPHNKHAAVAAFKECPAPQTLYIPLAQHIGKPATAVVAAGDAVKAGTLIGKADGFVSADIFSSVSGTVKAVTRLKTPTGACDHVVIENDGRYDEQKLAPLADKSAESLLKRVREAGLVGMGGAGFPSHVKFAPKTAVDTFIINAAECEPYITCDYRLIKERAAEFICGANYLARIIGLDKFYVGIEDNKSDLVEILDAAAENAGARAEVVLLKSKYPQGAEKQLIYAVTGRKVPLGKLPADVGVVVGNVHTAYALYDAVENNTPLYRRAVTIGGGAIAEPSNLWVRTGTRFSDCAEFCGGVSDDCVKLLSGGPMMGFALGDLDYSVTKTTGAVLALTSAEANTLQPQPCINCGRCARACPMNLMPMYIDAYTLRGDYATAKKFGATSCIECGCCAFSCPAKRPIVQSVRLCKNKIKELKL